MLWGYGQNHRRDFSRCTCDAVGLWAESQERFFPVYMWCCGVMGRITGEIFPGVHVMLWGYGQNHRRDFSRCTCDAVGLWAESQERFFPVYMWRCGMGRIARLLSQLRHGKRSSHYVLVKRWRCWRSQRSVVPTKTWKTSLRDLWSHRSRQTAFTQLTHNVITTLLENCTEGYSR